MKKVKTILAGLCLVTLCSCEAITGKEVARLNMDQISTQENLDWKSTTLDLQAKEKVYFWAEMDMEYEGDLGLVYQVQVMKGADTLGVIELDPMDKDMTVGEVQTTFGDKTDWSFTGRMNFLNIEEDGPYTFRAILVSSPNETLKLKKADLVLKKK